MPGDELTLLNPLQNSLHLIFITLIIILILTIVGVLLRWMTHVWKTRATALDQKVNRGLVSLHHTLSELKSEAADYPSNIPAPYGPIVLQLQATIADIDTSYQTIAGRITDLSSHPLELPQHAWAKIGHWFWHEPRHWWYRRRTLSKLIDSLTAPRIEAAAANTMLRNLRKQPLDTANQARELYKLVDTAQHTAGLLKTEGVHGPPLDRVAEALKMYRKTLTELPIYLLACTESQIIRRARPTEIAEAWATVDALNDKIHKSTDQVATWHTAYTLAKEELQTMCHCVEAATDCIRETPDAIDISDLSAAWHQTSEEAEILAACYEAPDINDLDCIAQITRITETANHVIAHVASMEAQHTALESSLTENADLLSQIGRQLRQLADANRYPLDNVPMQVSLDELIRQASAISSPEPESVRPRTLAQLKADLATAQRLKQQIQTLAARVVKAREQRRHLIELLDKHAEEPQVDWMSWANDLYQRTNIYAEANWFSTNGSKKPLATGTEQPIDDLHIRTLMHDAAQLAERQTRWIPTHVNEPLVPGELGKRTAEIAALFVDIETFQDRLDKITQRFQLCRKIEEKAKSDLATVYGAADRLDIVAADVLPPALTNENNHWTQIREQLDFGYEIELTLANPGVGTVYQKSQRVAKWIAETREILSDWHRTLEQEMNDTTATLADDLYKLTAIAPLDNETAVERAREVTENKTAQTRTRSRYTRKSRTNERTGISGEETPHLTAQLAGDIANQLRALIDVDQTLTALHINAIGPLSEPIRIWRETERTAEDAFDALRKLEFESTRLWPPISCDTAPAKEEFDRAARIRDSLYQNGNTVAQVAATITTLINTYATVTTMVEQREATYRTQRPPIDNIIENVETWCAALEHYRDQHSSDPAIVSAIRTRLDEIETAWVQLQVRYDQAPGLVSGQVAQRDLEDLWRQARRKLPLGPGMDVISPEEIEA